MCDDIRLFHVYVTANDSNVIGKEQVEDDKQMCEVQRKAKMVDSRGEQTE